METHKPKIIRGGNSVLLLLSRTTRNFGKVVNVRDTQNRSRPVKNNLPYLKHSRKSIIGWQIHCVPCDEDVLWQLLHSGKQRTPLSVSGLHCNHYLSKYKTKMYQDINPYPTAFPYGNGMVLHFYQQQESSTTKPVHKVINKRLKTYV